MGWVAPPYPRLSLHCLFFVEILGLEVKDVRSIDLKILFLAELVYLPILRAALVMALCMMIIKLVMREQDKAMKKGTAELRKHSLS